MTGTRKVKTDLIKKVSRLCLSKKETILFQKILEKCLKNWNDNDIEFLLLLYDLHHHPVLSIGGMSIYSFDQEDEIQREITSKKVNAINRLSEDPYSLWFKNARNYK